MKIRCLSVKQILEEETIAQLAANKTIEEIGDLEEYIKVICSEKALTVGGLVKFLKADDEKEFTKSYSKFRLRTMVKDLIVKYPGGSYTSRELRKGWKERKSWLRTFFYFHPEHLEQETQEKVRNKTW